MANHRYDTSLPRTIVREGIQLFLKTGRPGSKYFTAITYSSINKARAGTISEHKPYHPHEDN